MGTILMIHAGLRRRKKLFVCLTIVMLVITAVMSSVLSARIGIAESVREARTLDAPYDCFGLIESRLVTDELLDTTRALDEVRTVSPAKGLAGHFEKNKSLFLVLRAASEATRIMNSNKTGWLEATPEIHDGEIYLSQAAASQMDLGIGDTVTVYLQTMPSEPQHFTLAGYMLDSLFGAYVTGTKQAYISNADFERLSRLAQATETEQVTADYSLIQVAMADDCPLSAAEFMRFLNRETGIFTASQFSFTTDTMESFTLLLVTTLTDVMVVFLAILMVILLIIIGHTISTGLELDYIDFGILKAQGASSLQLRIMLGAQYLMALLLGAALGIIVSIPLAQLIAKLFQPFTAIPAAISVAWGTVLSILFAIIILTVLFLTWMTRKVVRISPIAAVNGGREDVYFPGRLQLPISGRALSLTLAIRQFTSAMRRYVGTVFIVAILTFSMLLVNTLDHSMRSRSALQRMGLQISDCQIAFRETPDEALLAEADGIVGRHSPFTVIGCKQIYLLLNDEHTVCKIYQDPSAIPVLKGRAPIHDNEIVITDILAEALGLQIGDTVTVGYEDREITCIITGYFQDINELGNLFAMSYAAAERIGITPIRQYYYMLEKPEYHTAVANALSERFPEDIALVGDSDNTSLLGDYSGIIDLLQIILYASSVLIFFIAISMTCNKILLLERRNLGIYRAIGFSGRTLRRQFAFRFLITATLGALIGIVANLTLSDAVLGSIMRLIGISHFRSEHTLRAMLIPFILVILSFYVFSWFTARRVKQVDIRELITE